MKKGRELMIDIPRDEGADDGIERRCLGSRHIVLIGLRCPMFVPFAIVMPGIASHENPLWSPS